MGLGCVGLGCVGRGVAWLVARAGCLGWLLGAGRVVPLLGGFVFWFVWGGCCVEELNPRLRQLSHPLSLCQGWKDALTKRKRVGAQKQPGAARGGG